MSAHFSMAQDHEDALALAAVSRNLEALGIHSIVRITPGPMTNRTAIGGVPREIVDNDMPDLVDTRDDWRQIPWSEPIAPGGIPRSVIAIPYDPREFANLRYPFALETLPRPALQLPDDDALAAEDDEACCVCLVHVPRAKLTPCGHVCLCMHCAQAPSITTCPLCRRTINVIERK